MNIRIKIIKCSNSILWYHRHIGQEFEVVKQEPNSYWVLEPNTQFRLINWVMKSDAELVQDNTKDANEIK